MRPSIGDTSHTGDTSDTEDDVTVEALRRRGALGPFVIADWHADTDTGTTRTHNEDRWCGDPERGFVIADGIGGHAGGGEAADMAASCMFDSIEQLAETSARRLIDHVNRAVVEIGDRHGFDQLGSTLCVLAVRRTHAVVVSVGDSRAYRWRQGGLEQLTRDHSVRAELDAAGIPLQSAIDSNVRLDALTSFIGRRHEIAPAYSAVSYAVASGDRFLLCTDGIHDQVPFAEIERAMSAASSRASVDLLLELARTAGGRDNATAIAMSFANK